MNFTGSIQRRAILAISWMLLFLCASIDKVPAQVAGSDTLQTGTFIDTVAENESLDFWDCGGDCILRLRRAVGRTAKKRIFTYPGFYLQPPFREAKLPYFDLNATKWMQHRYSIYPDTLQHGCFIAPWAELYDSLMYLAIQDEYGPAIFERIRRESDSLEQAGAGLTLPFIRSAVATSVLLHQTFDVALQDTAGFPLPDLMFTFQNGKVSEARAVFASPSIVLEVDHFNRKTKALTRKAKKLAWVPPFFLKQPTDDIVIWNLRTGALRFQ